MGTLSIQEAGAIARRYAGQQDVDYASDEVQRDGRAVLRSLIENNAVVGEGSQGDASAAAQFAMMAVTQGQERVTIDGKFGSRRSHQSTDLMARVQRALGERHTKYQGRGPEAAGRNTFVAMYNAMAPGASALQNGLTPPAAEPTAAQRRDQRAANLERYRQLAEQGEQPAEPRPVVSAEAEDRRVQEPVRPQVVPQQPLDGPRVQALVAEASKLEGEARINAFRELGATLGNLPQGSDPQAVGTAFTDALKEGSGTERQARIFDFLRANQAGPVHDGVINALGEDQALWRQLRAAAGARSDEAKALRESLSFGTLRALAGPDTVRDSQWSTLRAASLFRAVPQELTPELARAEVGLVAPSLTDYSAGVVLGRHAAVPGRFDDTVEAAHNGLVNAMRANRLSTAQAVARINEFYGANVTPIDELARTRQTFAQNLTARLLTTTDGPNALSAGTRAALYAGLATGRSESTSPILLSMPAELYNPMRDAVATASVSYRWQFLGTYTTDARARLEDDRARFAGAPQVPQSR